MEKAYKCAPALVKDRLKTEDPKLVDLLDSCAEDDVVSIGGTYDHIHRVLEAVGIPFAHITQGTLCRSDTQLRSDQTVFVNCADSFPHEGAMKLQGFVESGGQLITTDWALKNVLEVAFPGFVEYNGQSTGDEVVGIEVIDKEDEVIKGFLGEDINAKPQWWLEGSSYPIKILNKEAVRVLVESKELAKNYQDGAVIVSFDYGKGTVYHMISHFYLQRTETRGELQSGTAVTYAAQKGVSKSVQDFLAKEEQEGAELNYGNVQAAVTSAEFVSRAVVRQKNKFSGGNVTKPVSRIKSDKLPARDGPFEQACCSSNASPLTSIAMDAVPTPSYDCPVKQKESSVAKKVGKKLKSLFAYVG